MESDEGERRVIMINIASRAVARYLSSSWPRSCRSSSALQNNKTEKAKMQLYIYILTAQLD